MIKRVNVTSDLNQTWCFGEPIPLLVRRGGRDIKRMTRSLHCWSGRGGRSERPLPQATTPSAPVSVAARRFIYGAATPPLEEGSGVPHMGIFDQKRTRNQ